MILTYLFAAAGEHIKFRDLWRSRCIGSCALAYSLKAFKDILVRERPEGSRYPCVELLCHRNMFDRLNRGQLSRKLRDHFRQLILF
jgi:hypothetical protein